MEGIREETGKKLTIAEVAEGLGTSRKTLLALINKNQSISPEIALKLGAAFKNTTAEFWLRVQENYDLAQARTKVNIENIRVFWQPGVVMG